MHAYEFEGLGSLAGGLFTSTASAVSSNGLVVVGSSDFSSEDQAFRWTQAGGMVGLGYLAGGFRSVASGVNSDGSVVVGLSLSASGNEAFRWTQAGGMVSLGYLAGGTSSVAYDVNSDGSVVVGSGSSASGEQAFRWTQAGNMVGLGYLVGGTSSTAYGVSSDGSVVVGYGSSASGEQAFRWTQAGNMVGLGHLVGGTSSYAYGVSSDGSAVVGYGSSASGNQAFRWTQAGNMVGLGYLVGGTSSTAYGVSSDGSVVVGEGTSNSGTQAFRWTQSTGMESLKDILVANGVDMTGWTLSSAKGVSDDGGTIVGEGIGPTGTEAYIARTNGILSPGDLNDSLAGMAPLGSTVSSMEQAITLAMMDAAHSAVLNTTSGLSSGDEMTGRTQFWVVGALISDSSFSGKDFGGEGGVGLTRYLANGLSVGGGMFSGKRSLDTDHGGNQKITTIGPGLFVTYAPETHGLRAQAGAIWHYIDMDLKRGYRNGAGSAQSDGTTQGYVFGLNGRLGWAFPVAERVTLQPFVQYNWQHVKINNYTESGGPFPASFDSRTDTMNRARLGLEAQYAHNESLDFWTWASWSHRFENKGSSMGGSLIGLNAFNYGGEPIDQNWGDAGVGLKWRPYDDFETFSRLGFGLDSQHNAEPDLALTIGLGWDI